MATEPDETPSTDPLADYQGEQTPVGVGYKFRAYDDGELRIEPGMIVVFDDPDAGMHVGECEFISQSVTVARITGVYAVDYSWEDGYTVEINTRGAIGRLDPTERYVGVYDPESGETFGGLTERQTKREAERFMQSDYTKYRRETWHMGKDGVPEDLWNRYDESDRSGPGCAYCREDNDQDRAEVSGE